MRVLASTYIEEKAKVLEATCTQARERSLKALDEGALLTAKVEQEMQRASTSWQRGCRGSMKRSTEQRLRPRRRALI